jgi:NAD(P)-dependent dehydrogenase (short-subunit alcohol dehydrogenase family)
MQIICSVRIRRAWSGERRSACCLADDAGFERGGNRERLGGRARGARLTVLYRGQGAPGVIIYNAVMGAPDQLLSASVDHLQAAYAVDVISAIVVAQVAAPAMRAAGFGTMIVTGGAFADHPIPALATVSLGKAALRSAATMLGADLEPDGIRVATLTIAGRIVAGTAFDPERIAERYWDVVRTDGQWQAEFRFTGE